MTVFALPCGILTLTTDFGLSEPFVGVMKGVLLARFPAARIIDLTHEIPPYRPVEAGFWLARAFGYFPLGTVHLAVVDPGVGTPREILALAAAGHLFIAPDNGLLAAVARGHPDCVIRRVSRGTLLRVGLPGASATFHGRDLFAPLAAELAAGSIAFEAVGPVWEQLVPDGLTAPPPSAELRGAVLTIDRFGNLITDIEAARLAGLHSPRVYAGGQVLELRRTYGEVARGAYLALVNSFGVLEVARAEGSAAEGLGMRRGDSVIVREGAPP